MLCCAKRPSPTHFALQSPSTQRCVMPVRYITFPAA